MGVKFGVLHYGKNTDSGYFWNRVLRIICGPKREEDAGVWTRLHNMRSSITCTLR